MIVSTQIPTSPNYLGYGRRPMRQMHYRNYRGYGDTASDILNGVVGALPVVVQGEKTIATMLSGGTPTGTSNLPISSPPNPNAFKAVSSGVPTWVWIAGGLVVVGGAAFLLTK